MESKVTLGLPPFTDEELARQYRVAREQYIDLLNELQKRGYTIFADPSCPGKVRIFKDERKDI